MRAPRLVPRRAREASPAQLAATGAGGGYGTDPIDGDRGYRRLGASPRETPWWTLEKSRSFSVAAYRMNPMARAIVDTYTSFCVGDSGVGYTVTNADVRAVVDEFWTDPRVQLGQRQDAMLRDHLLMGELAYELMVGPRSGVVRFSPIDPSRVKDVTLHGGNPLWPAGVRIDTTDSEPLAVMSVNDLTGLREGRVMFEASWRALLTDRRGQPFLAPIVDWLDSYDTVLSNLIDRTAVARYVAWQYTVKGGQPEVDEFVKARGGTHAPPSGSIEVTNESVDIKPLSAQSGAYEDKTTAGAVMTSIAAGAGLAKTWLAEPEDANRATSLTMAEPVRRRVGGVQNTWLGYMGELVAFQVDRAVAAGRLPRLVPSTDTKTGTETQVAPWRTVRVTGPAIAAADAQVTAEVLVKLSQGLAFMRRHNLLSEDACRVLAEKGWEGFAGVPYTADLDAEDGSKADDLAGEIDKQQTRPRPVV